MVIKLTRRARTDALPKRTSGLRWGGLSEAELETALALRFPGPEEIVKLSPAARYFRVCMSWLLWTRRNGNLANGLIEHRDFQEIGHGRAVLIWASLI